jgi:hypothetical protein
VRKTKTIRPLPGWDRSIAEEALIASAGDKVGSDESGRLTWLLDFCQRHDFHTLNPAQLLSIAAEVHVFTLATPHVQRAMRSEMRLAADSVALAQAAKNIEDGVRAQMEGRPWVVSTPGATRGSMPAGDGRVVTFYTGPLLDRFQLAAQDAVGRDFRHMGRCARSGCGRLFLIVRRAKFCSPACGRLEWSQRARTVQAKKTDRQLYEERRDRYVAQYAKDHGIKEAQARKLITERGPRKARKESV